MLHFQKRRPAPVVLEAAAKQIMAPILVEAQVTKLLLLDHTPMLALALQVEMDIQAIIVLAVEAVQVR